MKKSLFFLNSILAAVLCLALSSCLGDDDGTNTENNTIKQTLPGLFAYATSTTDDAAGTFSTGVNYEIVINYEENSISVNIINLSVGGISYGDITIGALESAGVDGWLVLKATTPSVKVSSGTAPAITNFELRYIDRIIGYENYPGVCINYDLGTGTHIMSGFSQQLFFGTTTGTLCLSETNTTEYQSTTPTYILTFNTTERTVNVNIYNNKLFAGMPYLSMVAANIPFSISGNKAVWTAESVTPTGTNGEALTTMPLSNMQGTLDFTAGMTMQYVLEPGAYEDITVPVAAAVQCDYKSVY